jgi:hypothetical protein
MIPQSKNNGRNRSRPNVSRNMRATQTGQQIDTSLRPDQMTRLAELYPKGVEQFDAMLACVGLDTILAPLKAAIRIELYLNCTECVRSLDWTRPVAGIKHKLTQIS